MSSAIASFSANEHLSKVFLVGMPGSGKSTLGKVLAKQLNYTFLDLDTLIEEQEGLPIPILFEQRGQAYFREAEAQALRAVAARPEHLVLATGGGAPCFCENMAFMISCGVTVYLKVSPQELVTRLTAFDLQARPLLRGKTPDALLQYLADTLAQREPFYLQASSTVAAGAGSVASVVQEVEQSLLAMSNQVNGSI